MKPKSRTWNTELYKDFANLDKTTKESPKQNRAQRSVIVKFYNWLTRKKL